MFDPKMMRQIGLYLGVGMEVAAAVLAGTFGGYFLDRHLGFTPWLTVAGVILGSCVALRRLMQVAKKFNQEVE